jgi:hypothetical protein
MLSFDVGLSRSIFPGRSFEVYPSRSNGDLQKLNRVATNRMRAAATSIEVGKYRAGGKRVKHFGLEFFHVLETAAI